MQDNVDNWEPEPLRAAQKFEEGKDTVWSITPIWVKLVGVLFIIFIFVTLFYVRYNERIKESQSAREAVTESSGGIRVKLNQGEGSGIFTEDGRKYDCTIIDENNATCTLK